MPLFVHVWWDKYLVLQEVLTHLHFKASSDKQASKEVRSYFFVLKKNLGCFLLAPGVSRKRLFGWKLFPEKNIMVLQTGGPLWEKSLVIAACRLSEKRAQKNTRNRNTITVSSTQNAVCFYCSFSRINTGSSFNISASSKTQKIAGTPCTANAMVIWEVPDSR